LVFDTAQVARWRILFSIFKKHGAEAAAAARVGMERELFRHTLAKNGVPVPPPSDDEF
jgi:hypothetical protein